MSDTVVVLLGLLTWVLVVGPLFLLWWLPEHREVQELKRRSAARFAPNRSQATAAERHRHRADRR
ncbi:MAG: hypothetical protein M3291_03755 [Actinomycetota bacterium]|nr:hypothetical protein [Actinomycetota bacterium]